jgi:hypothetical protein
LGGTGGGGNGAIVSNTAGSPATANTGGGGGGSSFTTGGASTQLGGNGGSGIVIIAYANTYSDIVAFSAGLVVNGVTTTGSNVPTSDTASRSGYKVYKFTSGTGTVTF